MKLKQILIIAGATVVAGAFSYLVYDHFRMAALYKKISSEDEALKVLQTPKTIIIEVVEESTKQATIDAVEDDQYQYSNGDDDVSYSPSDIPDSQD